MSVTVFELKTSIDSRNRRKGYLGAYFGSNIQSEITN